MVEPPSLEKLVQEFASLPGIGKKTARRLAYFVLTRPRERAEALSNTIVEACDKVKRCSQCHSFAEEDPCPICKAREGSRSICVVEKFSDILPFENAGIYHGLYFVLGEFFPARRCRPRNVAYSATDPKNSNGKDRRGNFCSRIEPGSGFDDTSHR